MTSRYFRATRIPIAFYVLAMIGLLGTGRAQSSESTIQATGKVWGYVRDSSGKPLANARVSLQPVTGDQLPPASQTLTAYTDVNGTYSFGALHPGVYTVRALVSGFAQAILGPVSLSDNQTRKIDLSLVASMSAAPTNSPSSAGKQSAAKPEFFDEPQFTVAGVTQATNAGGHGSDTALRTTEALAKATLSLGKEPADGLGVSGSPATESSLRDAIAHAPNDSTLHHRLGDLEENSGHPLEAVHEYQRAAELDPSEPNMFDWGTELLTHRALEPAGEVFAKGNHLFPTSVRMLVALGVTWYARGSYDRASQCLENASDLAPDNSTPYLFLGKMLSGETIPSPGSVTRLSRFAETQPDDASANYYYALALARQSANAGDVRGDQDASRSAQIESLLQKTLRLDPRFGAAYLQLGILRARRADFVAAIPLYRKAIETIPQGDDAQVEAHYRLAQAYQRTGEKKAAKAELDVRDRLAEKIKRDSAQERREIQEFVISLRNKTAPTTQP